MKPLIRISCLAATALAMVTATGANAQTNLQPQIVLRPLTAVDVSTYGLPASSDYSGGLTTIGVGTPAYLEVEINTNFPAANVTNVSWSITSKPGNSTATLQASPLGTNVPIYEPTDRLVYQIAPGSRKVLRPDAVGQYTLKATITTTSGTTNLTQTITAGTYMGDYTCELCHSGGQVAADRWHPWSQTAHAHMFSDEIDGLLGSTMKMSCLQCHTTGYDTNALAVNGGFDDVATQYHWTIPPVLTNGNWASMQTNYPYVADLANVQCESCHGPGSQHAGLYGNTNLAMWPSITISYNSGTCNQCHDDATHHPYGTEWLNSAHAVTTRDPAGNATCVGCHTSIGFIDRVSGITNNVDTSYMPINCQTCHEPHGITAPTNNVYMIRVLTNVVLMDGTVISNAGEGLLCMQCHHARQKASTYASTTKGSQYFGPHEGPQADMIEGANGFTYGQNIPSSAHANAVSNTCVACHMQNIASTDPAFTHAGGHTFNVSYNNEDLVAACQQCHGAAITSFDFPLQDYNGDGVIQGVQDEVQSLLNKLSTYLPPNNSVKTSLSIDSTWTQPQLEAAYNWLFVVKDGSLGIHNTAYTVGLLKASIANLTGDANNDGLPDAWQTNYFSSINNPLAAPNAINNTNGVPNWMMYALGLDPTQNGVTVPGGVVWIDGASLVNSGVTNTVHIYTAAEVSFNTVSGNTYQIQGISALSGAWQNIGGPVLGTGQPVSYLTPTRNNAQMFFRVIVNP